MTTQLQTLAARARPINDADWGTVRQIDAENIFFDHVRLHLTEAEFADLEDYCLKATTDERIDRALRLVGRRFPHLV